MLRIFEGSFFAGLGDLSFTYSGSSEETSGNKDTFSSKTTNIKGKIRLSWMDRNPPCKIEVFFCDLLITELFGKIPAKNLHFDK